jgi:hypothetical protein
LPTVTHLRTRDVRDEPGPHTLWSTKRWTATWTGPLVAYDKHLYLRGLLRAPGRIRTCDARFRNPIRWVSSGLVLFRLACSGWVLVSLSRIQNHRITCPGWTIGWTNRPARRPLRRTTGRCTIAGVIVADRSHRRRRRASRAAWDPKSRSTEIGTALSSRPSRTRRSGTVPRYPDTARRVTATECALSESVAGESANASPRGPATLGAGELRSLSGRDLASRVGHGSRF